MNKASLRAHFRGLRINLPMKRQQEAKSLLMDSLYPKLSSFNMILSFSSLPDELDLWPLNTILAKEKRLALPRLETRLIQPYKVKNINTDLEKSSFSIKEPQPHICPILALHDIDCILVPGLCFDSDNHRLGFGYGHYDRFLAQIHHIPTFGIGFKEQKVDRLPTEPHDIPLTKIYLY
ncbi:MAG: 5-formyltetrahydrofolate cyclo-ligase [Chlamydiales bacterium]|nr:5-formyltetrahydrofolate cyclo-ligase [Chlamydiales bacterium]